MAQSSLLLLSVAGLLAAPVSAQVTSLDYVMDDQLSSIDIGASIGLDLTGTLRGAFDAASNPGGTRTQLGLFGDDGTNQAANLSLLLALGIDIDGGLQGGFTLLLDEAQGTAGIEGLLFELAGPASGAGVDLTLEYETFRTFAPDSVYLGGFPLPLPLGSISIDAVRFEQSGPAVGVAAPTGEPGRFDVTLLAPVDFSFELNGGPLGGGAPTPVGPVPLLLPLQLSVDRADCGSLADGGAAESFSQSIPSPVPFSFDDLPFDLPTLFPPGATANLLLSAGLDSLSVDGSFGFAISATSADGRVEDICAGNVNSTGAGAAMAALGSTSLDAADLGLQITGLPAESFGMLVMSQAQDLVPGFGGSQGTLCLGEPCYRFVDDVMNSGAAGEVLISPDFGSLPQGVTFLEAETWNFQWWYRDRNPGQTSNTSGAVAVTFCQ